MAKVLALVSDLIFRSKISGTAGAVGVEITTISSADALGGALDDDELQRVILDLEAVRTELGSLVETIRTRRGELNIIGYCSHVDGALIEAAIRAGVDEVLPRSAFSARLPELLQQTA